MFEIFYIAPVWAIILGVVTLLSLTGTATKCFFRNYPTTRDGFWRCIYYHIHSVLGGIFTLICTALAIAIVVVICEYPEQARMITQYSLITVTSLYLLSFPGALIAKLEGQPKSEYTGRVSYFLEKMRLGFIGILAIGFIGMAAGYVCVFCLFPYQVAIGSIVIGTIIYYTNSLGKDVAYEECVLVIVDESTSFAVQETPECGINVL